MLSKTNTKIVDTLTEWRAQLKIIHTCFIAHGKPTIMDKDLSCMDIKISKLNLQTENSNSNFFVPLPKSRLTPSPCTLPDHTLFPDSKDKKTKKAFALGNRFSRDILPAHFLMSLLGLKTSTPIDVAEYVFLPCLLALLQFIIQGRAPTVLLQQ